MRFPATPVHGPLPADQRLNELDMPTLARGSMVSKKNPIPLSMAIVLKAGLFAAEKHKNQRRKDAEASPYINHPIALANVLADEGGIDEADVLCAALLHDTVEDTETSAEELKALFGQDVLSIVLEVTDDKSLPKEVRKQAQIDNAPHLSCEAKLVKLADKICNLRDILTAPPADWSAERKRDYFSWAGKVVAGIRGVHPRLEAVFDALVERQREIC
jgi:guanosine-3',5'-bis(diphosphate) 3'-pyrophosphohydrolase